MADSGKRKRGTVTVDVLICKTCGAYAVSVNHYLITSHKCVGSWKIARSEKVEVADIHKALGRPRLETSKADG